MNYIAFVTKGLEKISAEELTAIDGVVVTQILQKYIYFEFTDDPSILKHVRTIDDIAIVVNQCDTEAFLSGTEKYLEFEVIKKSISIIKEFREVKDNFSITIGLHKSPEKVRSELQVKFAEIISKNIHLEFTPLDHSNIDIRIVIEKNQTTLCVKLFSESLFKRAYQHQSKVGSLRSTIAAAMLYKLTRNYKHVKVVDNFCGSGTFLCEANALGAEIFGGDIDKSAVILTKHNLAKLGITNPQVFSQSAIKTNWANNSFDIAIANFPWDKQIEVASFSEIFGGSIKEYSRIVKSNARLGFISTKPELVHKYVKKYFTVKSVETYKVGYLGQTPTIQLFYT